MNKIALLIPAFLLLAYLEYWLNCKTKKGMFSKENTILNISIGAIDQILSIAHYFIFFIFLDYLYSHYRIFSWQTNFGHWLLAYFAVDFVSYWYHRFSHKTNILWAGHVTHHSSQFFNYTNGFRTSPFQGLNRIIFWAPLPLLGFSPYVLLVTFGISGIYDFFLHTENIPRIKWLEKILITPALHSVHHGRNNIYLDKNFGSTFVIWDKLFGTFQEPLEKVEYGIKSEQYKDIDPINAIFFHYKYLWKKFNSIPFIGTKIKFLFMPPDWEPKPSKKIEIKYKKTISIKLIHRKYAVFQFISCAVGILIILLMKNWIQQWLFISLAALFLSGMITSARIFNNYITKHFKRNEIIRHTLFLIFYSSWLYFYPNKYIIVLGIFLLASFLFSLKLPDNPTHHNNYRI